MNGRSVHADVDRRRRGNGGDEDGASAGPVLITGGAGFVGTNLADRLLADGERVVILDDLSRGGVIENLAWLRARHGKALQHIAADIRDVAGVESAVEDCTFVFHFAAQVAVTTSLLDPREDHAINVIGTLNVLEAMRRCSRPPGLLFASTNKVYGALPDVAIRRDGERVVPDDAEIRSHGIGEQRPLDFISPYGCSKGAADQYVLDYGGSFGLKTAVFRMSCIYGPHQQATSDQGWVAHFLKTALTGARLTIFGDGRQVRDVLYVEDFVDALITARCELHRIAGQAFNIGGGVANTLSLRELIAMAERLNGHPMDLQYAEPRPGDQPWFAADHRRFSSLTGWQPRTRPRQGIEALWAWLQEDGHGARAPVLDASEGQRSESRT